MSMKISSEAKILFLGPHTDDVEISAGGTAARLIREGCDCMYVALSDCKQSVPEGFESDALRIEALSASRVLGFSEARVRIEEFPVRYFEEKRQEILDYMIRLREEFSPDIVFFPSKYDFHQDHEVVCREAIRAFKGSTLMGYETPWNNIETRHDCFIELEESDIEAKWRALSKFETQTSRTYFSADYTRSLALIRGQQAGYKFAEGFSVYRIKSSL